MKRMNPADNKFHAGAPDGKHYWLTPPELMARLGAEFGFDFDACPYPKPDDFDGLTANWGRSTYANIPFGSIMHQGKRKGPTAWMRKAIAEHRKGNASVVLYPVDKWVLMMLAEGAEVRNLGDVRWHAIEDGQPGKGTGRHIAAFILRGKPVSSGEELREVECQDLAFYEEGRAKRFRKDTGAMIFDRPLSAEEKQLPLSLGIVKGSKKEAEPVSTNSD